MPAREVDHRPVVADRHEVAAVRDLISSQAQAERGCFDRRPTSVEPLRVVPEDRHVADVRPGRQPRRDHGGATNLTPRGKARQRRHRRRLERRAPAEHVDRFVGASVGDADHVLHQPTLCRACENDGGGSSHALRTRAPLLRRRQPCDGDERLARDLCRPGHAGPDPAAVPRRCGQAGRPGRARRRRAQGRARSRSTPSKPG